MNTAQLEQATKAAYPELWPDDFDALPPQNKASLAYHRQAAMDRARAAIEAYGEKRPASGGLTAQEVPIRLPGDAALVQQVLVTVAYIDTEGRTAYDVSTMGEGLMTTWLGMNTLTQHYLLNQPGSTGGTEN